MKRILIVCAVLALPTLVHAEPGDPIRITLAPSDVPTPSLKYRLTPDPRTLKDGNAATLYYRTLAMFVENRQLLERLNSEPGDDWLDTPLENFPRQEVRQHVEQVRNFFAELERGTQYRDCDWRLHNREEGIALLLPDIQGFRLLATQIALRVRLYLAEKNYLEAVRSLRVGYTLGRHMGEGSTLIQALVGLAICRLMSDQLDTLIAQPDSPNLYWALATSPRPMFDLRRSIEGESTMLESMWPWLKTLDETPMSLYQVQEGMKQIERRLDDFNLVKPSVGQRVARSALLAARYEQAKHALIDAGLDKTKVEAMPVIQAIALWSFREYRQAEDEVTKWLHLPGGIYHAQYEKALERRNTAVQTLDTLFFRRLLDGLGGGGFNYASVQEAVNQLERRRAAQLALEAIRLHAARHAGWPKSLEVIEDVIVLPDPFSGKPFQYKRVGDTASLVSPLHAKERVERGHRVSYQLTLKEMTQSE